MTTPPAPKPGRLAGLSDESVLDALLAAIRQVAADDGVGARVRRRGYAHLTVEVVVRDFEIVGVDVGSKATLRRDR